MYHTIVARLCRADNIRVLKDTVRTLGTGKACKLGNFYAITKEDVEKIKAPPESESKSIPSAEPKEPSSEQTAETGSTEDVETGEQPVVEEK